VDQSGNLRTEDGALVAAPLEAIAAILERNPYRRAQLTPAGHLVVRVDSGGSDDIEWQFLDSIAMPVESGEDTVIALRVRTSSGRRVIALEEQLKRGVVRFALGPDTSRTPEGGQARDRLLEWIRSLETQRGIAVKEIYWDNANRYWLEISGERIFYDGALAPLEFKQ
jgi:hypothetical protein